MSQPENNFLSKISALILCAGEGSRLKTISRELPKPLMKIDSLNNASILQHTVQSLVKMGISRIILVKGHLGQKIDGFVRESNQNDKNLAGRLFVLDASNDYLKGPLYSFLALTKSKEFFVPNQIYFVMPGDTIFSPTLIEEIIKSAEKVISNRKTIGPIVFYRKIKVLELTTNYEQAPGESSKIISVMRVKRRIFNTYLSEISSYELKHSKKNCIKQAIPMFIFPHKFIQILAELEKQGSYKTIREVLNLAIHNKNLVITIKTNKIHNFYDIDSESDLKDFKNQKK